MGKLRCSWRISSYCFTCCVTHIMISCSIHLDLIMIIMVMKRSNKLSTGIYNNLVSDRWFSPGSPVCSTNKTDCHDITEIFLKVALNTRNLTLIFYHLYLHDIEILPHYLDGNLLRVEPSDGDYYYTYHTAAYWSIKTLMVDILCYGSVNCHTELVLFCYNLHPVKTVKKVL